MGVREEELEDVAAVVTFLARETDAERLWYRGHGCHRRHLLPSLYRRRIGGTIPQILELEQRLIARFRQRSLPWWPDGYPQTDWEQLFAMQHFGVPTRLLDWTENALTAVFFATDHAVERCECRTGDCRPTLWVLDPAAFNGGNPRLEGMPVQILTPREGSSTDSWRPGTAEPLFAPWPIAVYGTHNSARIATQQGTFTIAGKNMLPLEDAVAVAQGTNVLTKIVITSDHRSTLAQLRRLGMTRSAIYPELASLALDIAAEEGL